MALVSALSLAVQLVPASALVSALVLDTQLVPVLELVSALALTAPLANLCTSAKMMGGPLEPKGNLSQGVAVDGVGTLEPKVRGRKQRRC